jgi:hypothetical protein
MVTEWSVGRANQRAGGLVGVIMPQRSFFNGKQGGAGSLQ